MKKYAIAAMATVVLGATGLFAKNQLNKNSDCCKPHAECCIKQDACCK